MKGIKWEWLLGTDTLILTFDSGKKVQLHGTQARQVWNEINQLQEDWNGSIRAIEHKLQYAQTAEFKRPGLSPGLYFVH